MGKAVGPSDRCFFHISVLVMVCIYTFKSGSEVLRVELLPVPTGNSRCTQSKELEPYQMNNFSRKLYLKSKKEKKNYISHFLIQVGLLKVNEMQKLN